MNRLGFLALLGVMAAGANAQFTTGNLVVLRAGDGSAALSAAATSVFIDQFTTGGTAVNSTAITSLTMSGTSGSDGYLNVSYFGGDSGNVNNWGVSFGGYSAAAGTAAIAATTSTAVPRKAGFLRFDGTQNGVNLTAGTNPFSATNPRGAAYDGVANAYAVVGGNSGVVRADGTTGASTVSSTTTTNIRTVQISGNDIFYGTGSGTTGIYMVAGGMTGTGITATNIFNLGASTTFSPYDFEIQRDGSGTPLQALMVDDHTTAVGGLYFANGWTGTTFGAPVQILTATAMSTALGGTGLGIRQMVVVGTDVYATTIETSANKIVKLSFANGFQSGLTSSSIVATAGANTVFRGIEVVPEPASIAALGLGMVGLLARRRRKNS